MNIRKVVTKGLMATAISGALAVIPMTLDGSTATAHADSVNWDAIAQCESGGNWSINTGNGHYGGLQFKPATWSSNGGVGNPATASRSEQIRVAENVLRTQGIKAWPKCGAKGMAAQVWGNAPTAPASPAPATVPAKATGCAGMPTSVFGGLLDLRKMCTALTTPRSAR
ncbi:Resuscitation-promoting factor RpfC [Mycolicibacterium vanbaalenii]|uniref:Resuscitation-promoting factor RpfC n=1 Tax=Mycolicibacterium vanbaalenii TaxID=110539 RepID=A0A5S9R883_MYCVN|nr:transglycosylase family protein [Mycolicibacterium vanbaalenii]CAA0135751.1 Resuscitation-promoting factor RpfC [Mycolicibacterium vanbaalenii]